MQTSVILVLIGFSVFVLVWFFRHRSVSLLGQLTRTGRSQMVRILHEDVLKHIYKSEVSQLAATVQSVGGQLNVSVDQAATLLSALQNKGLVTLADEHFRLTEEGREYALHIIRAHRLWERHLADRTGVAETDWHGQAEVQEHQLSLEAADELDAELGHPTHDPHGDPVPKAKGRLSRPKGTSLLKMEPGEDAKIVHVEDEPPRVYKELVDNNLYPGMAFRLIEKSSDRAILRVEGSERTISSMAAANLTVLQTTDVHEQEISSVTKLSQLQPGQQGKVVVVSRASRASERRRFMDLGILPGTVIEAVLSGPAGDPMAYRIRGALIALRQEQTDHILVTPVEDYAA